LLGIDELQLNMILKRINLKCITSFSLHIQKYESWPSKTTEQYLSSIMAQSTLRKVEFNLRADRLSNIQWPSNCRIEYLIIDRYIRMDNLFRIISCSPQLHTLIIKQKLTNVLQNVNKDLPFPQITSLTLEGLDMTIDQLESFLLLTPSLIYLKLIGNGYAFDGKRWEEFLQVNLPHLNKFEFFISFWRLNDQTRDDLQLIIESFHTPFWIEHKKWFVACEFHLKKPRQIQMYSIPICETIFEYRLDSEKCFLSTSNDLSITKNINEIILPLIVSFNNDTFKRINLSFPNVTKLSIDLSRKMTINLIHYLPSIINISQLIEIKLESFYFGKDNKDHLFDLINLIEGSTKLSCLTIHSRYAKYELYPFLNDLCSILPRQINQLQIAINQLEQIEIILARCQYLSVVKFEITGAKFSAEVVQWFQQNTIDSMFGRHSGCDCIWIGKKINQINQNPKRIKLMDKKSIS
jgi:hypothetical protein